MKIVTANQMRKIEQECAQHGLPAIVLMENAGKAVAMAVTGIMGKSQKKVIILVGPGNNGGDGLVASRYLYEYGNKVCIYLLRPRPQDDLNMAYIKEGEVEIIDGIRDEDLKQLETWLLSVDVVIDAVFGTGKSRRIEGDFARVLGKVGEIKAQNKSMTVFALDLPSGLDADTGAIDPACISADYTITLGFPKPGLFNMPGAEKAGRVKVVDIGIPAGLAADITPELVTDGWVRSVLPQRPLAANKGTFGKVMIVAGSTNYIGAAYLACTGAMRVGAGLVTLAILESLQPILASKLTEVTYLPLPESEKGVPSLDSTKLIKQAIKGYSTLLMGCGLGHNRGVAELVESLILSDDRPRIPMVIDADGLNILSDLVRREKVWHRLPDDVILTPHPGEMARLTGMAVDMIQANRTDVTLKAAREWHKIIVLKGAYTVIADADGRVMISPFANPGLASAGTGDILAGVISGLVAQGMSFFEAAVTGVYLHGKAGEMVSERLGDTGIVAGDLLPVLPIAIKQIKETRLK